MHIISYLHVDMSGQQQCTHHWPEASACQQLPWLPNAVSAAKDPAIALKEVLDFDADFDQVLDLASKVRFRWIFRASSFCSCQTCPLRRKR